MSNEMVEKWVEQRLSFHALIAAHFTSWRSVLH